MKPNLYKQKLLTACVLFTLMFTAFGVKAQKTRELTQEEEADNKKASVKRIALVIGNGAYTKAKPLPNPSNDAADMAKTLRELGFEVISGVDQNKRQMETLIREFGTKLASSGGVGLFYYAGHGLQVGGENYLVPVDADIPEEDEVAYSAVPIGLVLGKMQTAKNDLNIVILDACRNNPFARSWRSFRDSSNSDGLAKISPPTGTLVLYATEPGKVASDGTGRNGLFTEALLKQIKRPDLEYDQMVKAVSADVWQKSKRQQLPWKEGNTLQDFYFAAKNLQKPNVAAQTTIDQPVRNESAVTTTNKPLPATTNNQITPNNNSEPIKPGSVRKSSIGIELVYVPPGEFMMGSTETEIDKVWAECKKEVSTCTRENFSIESPKRKVTIKDGFWLGKFEVTQAQWQAVMGDNPSFYKDCGADCPVEQVSWNDIQNFLKRLNAQDSQFEYRLPSEAEWEYAARAGTTTAFYFGDSLNDRQANFSADSIAVILRGQGTVRKTVNVGSYRPNAFGLYDMHGNVFERVQDIFSQSYAGLPSDGSANISLGYPNYHMARGGAFSYTGIYSRSATRLNSLSDSRDRNFGFRVAARLK